MVEDGIWKGRDIEVVSTVVVEIKVEEGIIAETVIVRREVALTALQK